MTGLTGEGLTDPGLRLISLGTDNYDVGSRGVNFSRFLDFQNTFWLKRCVLASKSMKKNC